MARYIIKRLVYAVLTLFVLITLVFFMMRMLPGDPFLGEKAISPTALANMNAKYGLDKPVFIQYLMYMGNCLTGALGMSITYNCPALVIVSSPAFCWAPSLPSSAAPCGIPCPCSSP